MALAFDGEPHHRTLTCRRCQREYPLITGFIADDGMARAVVFVACHSHDGRSEAWIDVALGSFVEPDFKDHVTFSCRVREDGASLVDGLVAAEGRAPFFGKKLSRTEALRHPASRTLWDVVDYVVTAEPCRERGTN